MLPYASLSVHRTLALPHHACDGLKKRDGTALGGTPGRSRALPRDLLSDMLRIEKYGMITSFNTADRLRGIDRGFDVTPSSHRHDACGDVMRPDLTRPAALSGLHAAHARMLESQGQAKVSPPR